MTTLRNRPTWQWVVLAIVAVLLAFWLFFAVGATGTDSHGVGKIQAASADEILPASDVLDGVGTDDSAVGVADNAPNCEGLTGGECETLFDVQPYTQQPETPEAPAPTATNVYPPGDPCAGLTGPECETYYDVSYYLPGSDYQQADSQPDPPPADSGGDSYAMPAGDDYCQSVWDTGGWDPNC